MQVLRFHNQLSKTAVIPAVSRSDLTQIIFRLYDLEDIVNPSKNL